MDVDIRESAYKLDMEMLSQGAELQGAFENLDAMLRNPETPVADFVKNYMEYKDAYERSGISDTAKYIDMADELAGRDAPKETESEILSEANEILTGMYDGKIRTGEGYEKLTDLADRLDENVTDLDACYEISQGVLTATDAGTNAYLRDLVDTYNKGVAGEDQLHVGDDGRIYTEEGYRVGGGQEDRYNALEDRTPKDGPEKTADEAAADEASAVERAENAYRNCILKGYSEETLKDAYLGPEDRLKGISAEHDVLIDKIEEALERSPDAESDKIARDVENDIKGEKDKQDDPVDKGIDSDTRVENNQNDVAGRTEKKDSSSGRLGINNTYSRTDDSKDVEISDQKRYEIRDAVEAEGAEGGLTRAEIEQEYDKRISELKEDLNAIKSDIMHFKELTAKMADNANPVHVRGMKEFHLLRYEIDSASRRYAATGGAVGENCFMQKIANSAQAGLNALDIYRAKGFSGSIINTGAGIDVHLHNIYEGTNIGFSGVGALSLLPIALSEVLGFIPGLAFRGINTLVDRYFDRLTSDGQADRDKESVDRDDRMSDTDHKEDLDPEDKTDISDGRDQDTADDLEKTEAGTENTEEDPVEKDPIEQDEPEEQAADDVENDLESEEPPDEDDPASDERDDTETDGQKEEDPADETEKNDDDVEQTSSDSVGKIVERVLESEGEDPPEAETGFPDDAAATDDMESVPDDAEASADVDGGTEEVAPAEADESVGNLVENSVEDPPDQTDEEELERSREDADEQKEDAVVTESEADMEAPVEESEVSDEHAEAQMEAKTDADEEDGDEAEIEEKDQDSEDVSIEYTDPLESQAQDAMDTTPADDATAEVAAQDDSLRGTEETAVDAENLRTEDQGEEKFYEIRDDIDQFLSDGMNGLDAETMVQSASDVMQNICENAEQLSECINPVEMAEEFMIDIRDMLPEGAMEEIVNALPDTEFADTVMQGINDALEPSGQFGQLEYNRDGEVINDSSWENTWDPVDQQQEDAIQRELTEHAAEVSQDDDLQVIQEEIRKINDMEAGGSREVDTGMDGGIDSGMDGGMDAGGGSGIEAGSEFADAVDAAAAAAV